MMQQRYPPFVPGRTSTFVPEGWAERVRKHLEKVGRMANNMKLEEAIAHLGESLNDQSHDWGCEECKQEHEQLREWLVELKERRAADVQPVRWIPVEEQLPETGKLVLVVDSDGDMTVAGWNGAFGWRQCWSGFRVINVTHWMPLPEPPKEEEEE